MFGADILWVRAFIKCIKEDGLENFSRYILRNHENGIIYTTYAHGHDYDLDDEIAILHLLRNGTT